MVVTWQALHQSQLIWNRLLTLWIVRTLGLQFVDKSKLVLNCRYILAIEPLKWVIDYKNKCFKSDYEFWNKCFLLFGKNQFLAFVFDCPFLTQNIPNFPIWLIYLGEIMCVGRVWCLTRAELRPRPAAAQSTPRPLKMSTKFREIVLKSKIHRHLYSNNRGFVSE